MFISVLTRLEKKKNKNDVVLLLVYTDDINSYPAGTERD